MKGQPQLFDYSADRPQLFDTSAYHSPSAAASVIPQANALPKRTQRTIQDPWGTSHPTGSGTQIPAFLSARQIKAGYQPLEGDRRDQYDEREGEATNRTETTGGYPNRTIRSNDRRAPYMIRQGQGESVASSDRMTHYRDFGHPESDEQLWSRKLEESQLSPDDYAEEHGGGGSTSNKTPGYETLEGRASAPPYNPRQTFDTTRGGGVEARTTEGSYWEKMNAYVERKADEHRMNRDWGSLHDKLSDAMRPGGEGFKGVVHLGTQPGPGGKPEVYGAHHRIAILDDVAPDRLLPVIHHAKFRDARQDQQYKYT